MIILHEIHLQTNFNVIIGVGIWPPNGDASSTDIHSQKFDYGSRCENMAWNHFADWNWNVNSKVLICTKCAKILNVYVPKRNRLGLRLFIWISFNPSMAKRWHPLWSMGWHYLSIPKFQWCSTEKNNFEMPPEWRLFCLVTKMSCCIMCWS